MLKTLNISYLEISDFNKISKIEKKILNEASKVLDNSYSPYSKFKVGASVLLEGDIIVSGANQENSSYPCGICAERVAVFSASSNYPGVLIKKVAITTKSTEFKLEFPAGPCGLCRQALLEFEEKQKNNIEIILFNSKKIIKIASVKELLPFFFVESKLKK
tara:strand:+ start:803 stop:1285 length:483 start_codon:yes stop_codon:yes gene_type:complete